MRRLPRLTLILPLLALVACGGGGGGGRGAATADAPPSGAPAGSQAQATPAPGGGIWHGISAASQESLTLLVAEDGTLRMLSGPTAAAGPAFGAGAMIVTAGDQVSGAYGAKRIRQTSLLGGAESCDFTGTVRARAALEIELECTDDSGVERSDSVMLRYDTHYEPDSSLAAIAGNYTLRFREQTNVLTIAEDGVVFGVYDNGFACTVNGLVGVIDAAFNLYRVEWQLSACEPPFARYDGALLTGLASFVPSSTPAFVVVLTGVVAGQLEGLSVLYERG